MDIYCLEAAQRLQDIYVARSIALTAGDDHYAMVSSFGKDLVQIPTGTLLSTCSPVRTSLENTACVSYVTAPDTLDPEFETDVKELDVNPDLSAEQQEALRDVVRRQHDAFAYGSRRLGQTDLAIMKIETGDAEPISQAPYHASPAGRKIIDDTLTELIAEEVIEESNSPWASPRYLSS